MELAVVAEPIPVTHATGVSCVTRVRYNNMADEE